MSNHTISTSSENYLKYHPLSARSKSSLRNLRDELQVAVEKSLLSDGEKEFKFTLGHINNTYYDSNPAIFPIVDDYYKQLEIKEEYID